MEREKERKKITQSGRDPRSPYIHVFPIYIYRAVGFDLRVLRIAPLWYGKKGKTIGGLPVSTSKGSAGFNDELYKRGLGIPDTYSR